MSMKRAPTRGALRARTRGALRARGQHVADFDHCAQAIVAGQIDLADLLLAVFRLDPGGVTRQEPGAEAAR